uniref:Uncharacterized protein n=1 Tax=Craspedostauros australis TaxID=1486917 RepID=A0A7R9ZIP3_9STRA|mmetsp:Transcript_11378/g.31499  ORF Transcript_11378/g.31499 Transcript_11378/m.31499 type:complete len:180 (+) Transcript_11378:382-921(+)
MLMTFMSCYMAHEARTKRRYRHASSASCWIIHGPTILMILASGLILMDPLRHYLQDQGYLRASMYIPNCPTRSYQTPPRSCTQSSECGAHHCGGEFYADRQGQDCFTCGMADGAAVGLTAGHVGRCSKGAEAFACLSRIGWMVTIACTYIGFVCFVVGVVWNTNLHLKIRNRWKLLRGT